MSLNGASDEELANREHALMSEVERIEGLGVRAGNRSVIRALKWSKNAYWPIRDRLVDQGRLELGKGKGGSVRIVRPHPPAVAPEAPSLAADQPVILDQVSQAPIPRIREDGLYDPIAGVLRTDWAKDKRYRELILEVTARQGKRETGGKWTRPDIAVATMTTLLYLPGKLFDVTTFEVKASDALDVTAVYEALSHRRAATRAYVWLHVPKSDSASEEVLSAINSEAKRHGIGVIVGSNPHDYDTWEEVVEAVRGEPDPQRLNDFIAVQFSAGNKNELLKWMR
jgi:hypothetical protein